MKSLKPSSISKLVCSIAFAALLAAAISPAGCGRKESQESQGAKVLIVGVDGVDMLILDRLRQRGEVPNFDRLIVEGSSGLLRSLEPILSPIIWTSIATGKTPDKHGILDFVIMDPTSGNPVPVTSRMREALAVWNIAGAHDRNVAFVGWLASWPAEDVNGIIVSDRLSYHSAAISEESRLSLCSPPSYIDTAERVAGDVGPVDLETLRDFVDITAEEFEEAKGDSFDISDPTNNLRLIYTTTETYRRLALKILAEEKPDLMGVYFEETDSVGHLFMPYEPPRMPGVTDEEMRKFGGAVEAAYRHMDDVLGQLMAAAGDEYCLIVLSDHGFKTGESRPRSAPSPKEPGAARWHRLHGVVMMWGPQIKPGMDLHGASVLDITPTVLALMGLPVAEDMDGRPLTDAFDDEFLLSNPIRTIATYETDDLGAEGTADEESGDAAAGSEMDGQMLERLKALGYLGSSPSEESGGEQAKPSDPGKLASWYSNRGVGLLRARRYEEAEEAFQQAVSSNPSSPINHNNLGLAAMELGKTRMAEESLKKAIALDSGYVNAHLNLGILYDRAGRDSLALAEYRRALELEPSKASVQGSLGSFYAKRGRYNEALPHMRKANEIEPHSGKLRRDYGAVNWSLGNMEEAERQFRQAVSLEPDSAQSHLLLAQALLAQGKQADAREHLERCLSIDPRNAEARKMLGR